MQIYLAATPQEAPVASAYGHPLAHVAYRIGPNSTLLRQNPLLQNHGGLLSISDREAPLISDVNELCAAVMRESSRRNYSGVILDFEETIRPDRRCFVEKLGQILKEKQKGLYLPESYAHITPNATILVGTAISGGNLRKHLQETIQQHNGKIALDMERIRMDFRLPARSGIGTPLTTEEFSALIARESPTVFFSRDLCARYFTYIRNNETHFVLFDDADTLKQKLRIGMELGCSAAFFMWPEIRDIADCLWK